MLTLDPTAMSFGMMLTLGFFLIVWTNERLAARQLRRRRHHATR